MKVTERSMNVQRKLNIRQHGVLNKRYYNLHQIRLKLKLHLMILYSNMNLYLALRLLYLILNMIFFFKQGLLLKIY